ncbi:MAG: PelD GGDEF domain-containing protein [Burkholderiaceae bacterium]
MRIPAAIRLKQSAAERAARRLLPRTVTLWKPSADWRIALGEALLVMGASLAVSWLLNPHDPFWTEGGFPWLWLAAAILALRYGSVIGVFAMAFALAGWFLLQTWGGLAGEFPRASFLGGLILALITGEFSDVWNARLAQAQAVNAYIDERLHALTHNHYLLSVSHERLEQELIARPFTLREMFAAMRARVLREEARDETLPAAAWLMQLLAQICRLECAALFAIDGAQLKPQAVASVGNFGALDESDPMLAAALESGQLTHVQSEPFIEDDRPSRYVVCAPAVASGGRLLGVLVAQRMPFTALTLETLQLITVLLAYYADSIDHAESTRPVLAAYPRCPGDFALELVRMQRLLATAAIRSSLVAFCARDSQSAAEWFSRIDRLRRTVDVGWSHSEDGLRVLLMLLPLTAQSGLSGYLERVGRSMREQYGADLDSAGLAVHTAEIGEAPLAEQLAAFLERCRA